MTQALHPYFSLSGEFEPDEITRRLGIEPSWVKRIGDPEPPGSTARRLGAEWGWQPHDDNSNDVGDQLAFLASSLSLRGEEVAKLSRKFFGTLHVCNRIDGVKRDWFVSAETLRLIADLHVYIECLNVRPAQQEETSGDAH